VGDSFSDRATIERLEGLQSIGHVRYSTTGETVLRNVQPLLPNSPAAVSRWPITAT
jgi:amidophosphoribosyltransferase